MQQIEGRAPPKSHISIPLYVDLDGTLIKTDMLFESLVALLKQKPWQIPLMMLWALRGRAYLKHRLALAAQIDISLIPVHAQLTEYLREQRALGRSIYLITGANVYHAEAFARHLGLFSGVFASTAAENMSSARKLEIIAARIGENPFAYAANAHVDVPIWRQARQVLVVEPAPGLLTRLRLGGITVQQLFATRRQPWVLLLRQLRVHQWTKNLLIFFPLLLKHELSVPSLRMRALLCFAAFCSVASSTYVLNDLLDLDADRRHHQKRKRPLAAGDFSIAWGLVTIVVLLSLGMVMALELTPPLALYLLTYCVTTVAYSFYLKRIILIDVGTLVFLYILRLMAGAEACDIEVSNWALAFFSLLFISLALAKRYAELHRLAHHRAVMPSGAVAHGQLGAERVSHGDTIHGQVAPGRDYSEIDLNFLGCCGLSAANTAVLVFALYINTPRAQTLYTHPERLWLLLPLVLYWLVRVWLLAYRGVLHEDPIYFAVRDKVSYGIALAALAVGLLAT